MAENDGGVSPTSSLTKHRSGKTAEEAVRFFGMIVGQRSCSVYPGANEGSCRDGDEPNSVAPSRLLDTGYARWWLGFPRIPALCVSASGLSFIRRGAGRGQREFGDTD